MCVRDSLAPGPEKIREWVISPGSGTPPFLCCLPWSAFYWLLGNILAIPVVVTVHMYSSSEDCTQELRTVHIPVVWVYTCTLPTEDNTQHWGQESETAKTKESLGYHSISSHFLCFGFYSSLNSSNIDQQHPVLGNKDQNCMNIIWATCIIWSSTLHILQNLP